MPRRDAIPLHKTRHADLIDAIHDFDDFAKSVAILLLVGTGVRADTIGHTHKSWFVYKNGGLYYKIPREDPCRKYGTTETCGECNRADADKYYPKTPAGEGREILLTNQWTNPVSRQKEYLGLKDYVEDYFALNGDRAPKEARYGNDMIDADGTSIGTLSDWLREIAAESDISPDLRESRLRKDLTIEEVDPDDPDKRDIPQINDYGKTKDGNLIPDVFAHDMRATFCTHLMRNDVPPYKAINLTGHSKPEAMDRYVRFAQDEIDKEEEANFY